MTLQFLATSLLHFLILLPLLLIAKRKEKTFLVKLLLVLLFIIILDNFCLYAFPKFFTTGLKWNWIGKLAELILCIFIILSYKPNPQISFGLTTKIRKGSIKPIIITFTIIALVINGLYYAVEGFKGGKTETILYQSTMPGITEELLYRGIILGIINLYTVKRWRIFGAEMGWGAFISSVLFGLAHGLLFDKNLNIYFDPVAFLFTGLLGFVFAWSKEKSGSIFPAIIGHNLINLLGSF